MKVNKVTAYEPDYPKKKNGLLVGAAAAAVMLSLGSTACRPRLGGAPLADPTELPDTTGGIAIATDEPVGLMGDVEVDFSEIPSLDGKIVADTQLPEYPSDGDNGQ